MFTLQKIGYMTSNGLALQTINQPLIYSFSKLTKIEKYLPKKIKDQPEQYYPKQHPRNIYDTNNEIISFEKPPMYLTPEREVPSDVYKLDVYADESLEFSRVVDVALVGAPNAGKSSLMNKIIGGQHSAVSSKSNTTDEVIKGVFTNIEKKTQVIFFDTPGITQVYKGTNSFTTKAWDQLQHADKVLFVVDSVKRFDESIKAALFRLKQLGIGEAEQKWLRKTKQLADQDIIEEKDLEKIKFEPSEGYGDSTIPAYLVMNKIDLCTNKRKLKWLISEIEDIGRFEKVFFTSAETGFGIDELMEELEQEAYSRKYEFKPEVKSEQHEGDILYEMMKTLIYEFYYKEIPFMVGIELYELRIREDGVVKIHYRLDTEKRSQVKVLIGKNGKNIKRLKEKLRAQLCQHFQKDVILKITVLKRKDKLADQLHKNEEYVLDDDLIDKKAEKQLELIEQKKISLDAAIKSF